MSSIERTTFHGLAAAILLAGAVLPVLAQTEVERRVEAKADGTVEITNVAGTIDISGWDRDEVEVIATLGRGVKELQVERRGSRVEIEVELHRGHGGRREKATAHLEVRLPRGSEVKVETVNSDITTSDLSGELEIESVSGSIEIHDGPPVLRIETVAGDVVVKSGVERLTVETVSGIVELHCGREIEVTAVSGRIQVLGREEIESAELEVVAGDIRFEGTLAPRGRLDASSHNGSIDVTLPESVSARFEVSTFSGRITNELGPEAKRVGRYTPEQEVTFETGSGEGRVTLESFAGSISIRKR